MHTALRNYEGRVTRYADELVSQIDSFGGKAINATHWFKAYAFDVIGDLAFGKSFDMLQTGEQVVSSPRLCTCLFGLTSAAFCTQNFTRRHGAVRISHARSLGLSYPH